MLIVYIQYDNIAVNLKMNKTLDVLMNTIQKKTLLSTAPEDSDSVAGLSSYRSVFMFSGGVALFLTVQKRNSRCSLFCTVISPPAVMADLWDWEPTVAPGATTLVCHQGIMPRAHSLLSVSSWLSQGLWSAEVIDFPQGRRGVHRSQRRRNTGSMRGVNKASPCFSFRG